MTKENNINFRELKLADIHSNLLKKFNRYQETKRVWVKEDKQYRFKDDYFVEQWDCGKKKQVIQSLRNCISSGGIVIGAFIDSDLIGFASVEGTVFGTRKEYLELSYIHVSNEYRNCGIGKRIFKLCCLKAKEKNVKKLYIGAHPSEETQSFYKSVGCTPALEINQDIYKREPLDIQLEIVL